MKLADTKLILAVLMSGMWSGCASSAPPLPPSLKLPMPVTDLRAVRKGDRVYLAWTVPVRTTDHETIRQPGSTLICRSTTVLTECGAGIGEVAAPAITASSSPKGAPAAKVTATYVDRLSDAYAQQANGSPADEVRYAVEVLNPERRGAGLSNQVTQPAAPALAPPGRFQAEITARGVRLTWSCASTSGAALAGRDRYRLRIYRRLEGSSEDSRVAEPDLTACPKPAEAGSGETQTFEDQTFEWGKTYEYRAAPVTVISEAGKPEVEIEGNDTASVRVSARDVFPPAVPSGLQAVFSGVGQPAFVDLIWSPDTEGDLAGYNVYRHEENGMPIKLSSELVKMPGYRDNQVQAGRKYFYSVSSVDVRGNESAKSEEANETVP